MAPRNEGDPITKEEAFALARELTYRAIDCVRGVAGTEDQNPYELISEALSFAAIAFPRKAEQMTYLRTQIQTIPNGDDIERAIALRILTEEVLTMAQQDKEKREE